MNYSAKIEEQLRKLGIEQKSDLLFYFPSRYEDFSKLAKIAELKRDQNVSLKVKINAIKGIARFGRHIGRAEAVVSDESGSIKVVWFNQPYLASSFQKGDVLYLSGRVQYYKSLQLQNPLYEKLTDDFSENIHTARILPIYRLSAELPLRTLRNIIHEALKDLPEIKERLPEQILKELELPDIRTMIKNLHFPLKIAMF